MFAPFGSPVENRTAQWHPEPQFRGTFGILSSCLVTIVLCIWTAVHLNVPEYDKHKKKVWPSRQFWRKTGWLVLGLFAPELVAWTAYEQYRLACQIHTMMLEYLHQIPKPSRLERFRRMLFRRRRDREPSGKNSETDLEKSLVMDAKNTTETNPGKDLKDSKMPVSLIAHKESIPQTDNQNQGANDNKDDIQIKSIATSAELQLKKDTPSSKRYPWTMTHSYYAAMGGYAVDDSDSDQKFMPEDRPRLTFKHQGLELLCRTDISLLPNLSESQIRDKSKASGLAKALVCIQATWFCVQCIFRLSQNLTICLLELNTFAHSLCALFIYMLWWKKPLDIEEPSLLSGQHKDEFAVALLCPNTLWRGSHSLRLNSSVNNTVGKFEFVVGTDQSTSSAGSPTIRKGEKVHGWVLTEVVTSREEAATNRDESDVVLSSKSLRLLELYGRAIALWPRESDAESTSARIRNWPPNNFEHIFGRWTSSAGRILAGFATAGLVYGGLHLCAWNAFFATKAQLDLWHISSIVLTASGLVAMLINLVIWGLAEWNRKHSDRVWSHVLKVILLFFMLCFSIIYIFARIYLVVECFLSLVHLPPSTLRTPTWSQYVPHIS